MPGHKGAGFLGVEQLDITEIDRGISDMVSNHSNNLVKKIASSSKRAQKAIDKYVEKYED